MIFLFGSARTGLGEHVRDLGGTYDALARLLARGGVMSHQIDYRCHETAGKWNGHWAYSDRTWRVLQGRRPYLINREPHSAHVARMHHAGMRIVRELPGIDITGIRRAQLAARFQGLSDADLTTRWAFVQAVKER